MNLRTLVLGLAVVATAGLNSYVAQADSQLDSLTKKGGTAAQAPLKDAIDAVVLNLEPLRSGKGESAPNLGAISEGLASLSTDVEGADRAPTSAQERVLTDYRARLDHALTEWQKVRGDTLARLDSRLREAGMKEIHVPTAAEIDIGEPAEGKDLP